ncbi:hypothetical protein BU23DRAFT_646239 [Bimuria novae-zelandiae CBS 107.79]|uniref:Heterokaryon incompatibility domain-containing protein n=1 Tax=Bimuria novae-zelandiae CBS 107.79 TaxID=1447943 RepID=A0A6A5V3T4_9PLEO|nr:hypothetical protein BU23DRAFT_646239 [Bimuria novae-zelandiae CBS 107.79]
MRLMHTETLALHELYEASLPPYAILSHTWQDEEVGFQDMVSGKAVTKVGYAKITSACVEARRGNHEWIWIGTCCIDKSPSAELSKAINSMYKWYENSQLCYAYLCDLSANETCPQEQMLEELERSRCWNFVGTEGMLRESISKVTRIDRMCLSDKFRIKFTCVAQKLYWAPMRETTRIEDLAYSLIGIFDVNMTLLYGEGKKAFQRLQGEIIRTSEDLTILAWDVPPRKNICNVDSAPESENDQSMAHQNDEKEL